MARPLRIEYAGALYHVTSRGDRRECIFEDDRDRQVFLSILESVVERFKWVCHAYCLMDNHYHLLVETPEPNLSRGMRQLNGVYTQKYNFMHNKTGHLFQGRYKAVVIEKESHLLEVSRYVVLNPVRAGMVETPQQWRWSSYGGTAGLRKVPAFLSIDWLLLYFAQRRAKAQREYRKFVREGMDSASPWENLVSGMLLGNEEFVAECRARLAGDIPMNELSREHRYIGRPSLSYLFNDIELADKSKRNNVAAKAYLEHGYTMKEIADYLGLHYMTVSRMVKAFESQM